MSIKNLLKKILKMLVKILHMKPVPYIMTKVQKEKVYMEQHQTMRLKN